MLRLLALIGVALAPTNAALAADPITRIGDRDGYRFEYRAQLDPTGIVRIEGRLIDSGKPFKLALAENGRVEGVVDGTSVSFRVDRARRRQVVAQLAGEADLASNIGSAGPASRNGQ